MRAGFSKRRTVGGQIDQAARPAEHLAELRLPFSDGGGVTYIIASLKTIREDGGFEIKNLIRGNHKLPMPKLRTIIDRDLFHRTPGRISSGRILEFG